VYVVGFGVAEEDRRSRRRGTRRSSSEREKAGQGVMLAVVSRIE
jgi:hypothetical protein